VALTNRTRMRPRSTKQYQLSACPSD
jgi:hypothetical protein